MNKRGVRQMNELKDQVGIDPLTDVDRVAVTPGGVMVTGQFGNARWDEVTKGMNMKPYGEKGRIYERPEEPVDE